MAGGYAVAGEFVAFQSSGWFDVVLHDPTLHRERKVGPYETLATGFIAADRNLLVRNGLDCGETRCDKLLMLHYLDTCVSMEVSRVDASDPRSFWASAQLVDGRFYYVEAPGRGGVAVELDLSTGARREFRSEEPSSTATALVRAGGGWAAIVETRPGSSRSDLRVVRLSTGESRWVTDSEAIEWDPKIAGGVLYWSDASRGVIGPTEDEHDIYALELDVEGAQIRAVVTSPGSQMIADVRGDELLWLDFRDGRWFPENRAGVVDLYVGKLSTGDQRKLTMTPRLRWSAKFLGDGFAWLQNDAPEGAPVDDRVWMAPLPAW